MAAPTTAETVIARLEAHGVRHVFGIPGTHNLRLYRALADSSIEHVLPRHEQGAGYAADGYARSEGGPGVCITTSGPGVLNLATAVATAHSDSVPMLVLATGMATSVAGGDTGYLHEARDQTGAMAGVAASAVRVADPVGAAAAIDAAFDRFRSGRPRPVYVEIPLDAMEATGDPPGPVEAGNDSPAPDPNRIAEAARLLSDAGRAAIVLGGGAADAGSPALKVARALGAPVITTANGKGAVSEKDPLSLGASIRLASAQRLLAECDAVLAAGTELAESDLWHKPPLVLNGSLIRIDIDPAQRNKNATATVAIVGDAGASLTALAAEIGDGDGRDRGAAAGEEVRAVLREEALADVGALSEVVAALDAGLSDEAILAGDSTMACYYGAVHLIPRTEPRSFLYPTGFAPLGYAIPAAIGAKLAQPERDVVALVGDGGAMFTLPELAAAAALGLGIVVVVVNDGGYGEIRREMVERGQPPIAVDMPSPDFAAAAKAFGARGAATEDAGELTGLIEEALNAGGPSLIEVRVGEPRRAGTSSTGPRPARP